MAQQLKGRVAVVTGAGRGIGRAIAMALAAEGASVVVNDLGVNLDGSGRSAGPADEVAQEIRQRGGQAVASYNSVADFQEAGKIIQTAVSTFGRLDILVNNAGITRNVAINEMSPEDFEAVLGVHLKGAFNCVRNACGPMISQRWGRIVNMVSRAGLLLRSARTSAYGAAKAGMYGFTNVISSDLAPHGITVNAVNPASTATRMTQRALQDMAARGESPERTRTHLLDLAPPEHVAPLIVFLCTDQAAGVTGQTFYVHGTEIGVFAPIAIARTVKADARAWTMEALGEAVPQLVGGP